MRILAIPLTLVIVLVLNGCDMITTINDDVGTEATGGSLVEAGRSGFIAKTVGEAWGQWGGGCGEDHEDGGCSGGCGDDHDDGGCGDDHDDGGCGDDHDDGGCGDDHDDGCGDDHDGECGGGGDDHEGGCSGGGNTMRPARDVYVKFDAHDAAPAKGSLYLAGTGRFEGIWFTGTVRWYLPAENVNETFFGGKITEGTVDTKCFLVSVQDNGEGADALPDRMQYKIYGTTSATCDHAPANLPKGHPIVMREGNLRVLAR